MEDVVMRQELLRAQEAINRLHTQLVAARDVVHEYRGWYEDAPEDSWRFERDIRAALDMEQYSGDDRWRPGMGVQPPPEHMGVQGPEGVRGPDGVLII